jgi:hypothetical protein
MGLRVRLREIRNAYRILVGGSEIERPLGIRRCTWENSVKMDLREMVCDGVHCR